MPILNIYRMDLLTTAQFGSQHVVWVQIDDYEVMRIKYDPNLVTIVDEIKEIAIQENRYKPRSNDTVRIRPFTVTLRTVLRP
jgi:hypothetical protein